MAKSFLHIAFIHKVSLQYITHVFDCDSDMQGHCHSVNSRGGLNNKCPPCFQSFEHWCLVMVVFGRFRKCNFVEAKMSLGLVFEDFKLQSPVSSHSLIHVFRLIM